MTDKPGYKTTEFWITLLTTLLMLAIANGMVDKDQELAWTTLIITIAPTIVYVLSRTKLKKGR